MDELVSILISGGINGVMLMLGVYIGTTRGASKTIDIALDKIEKKTKDSPTVQRLLKLLSTSDKLFGDEQAVEQITKFFKEARELVGSEDARQFFRVATEALKEFASSEPQVKLKLPVKSLEKQKT